MLERLIRRINSDLKPVAVALTSAVGRVSTLGYYILEAVALSPGDEVFGFTVKAGQESDAGVADDFAQETLPIFQRPN